MITCSRCGAPIEDGKYYCTKCGAPLPAQTGNPTDTSVPDSSALNRLGPLQADDSKAHASFNWAGWGGIILKCLVFFLIAGGAVYWYFNIRSTPETASQQLVQAVLKGDTQGITALVTKNSQSFVQAQNLNLMRAYLGLQNGIQSHVLVSDISTSGDTASTQVTIQPLATEEPVKATFELQKEDGRWKVDLPKTASLILRR